MLTESERVHFLRPGESFYNGSTEELVIMSKGSYVLIVEAAHSVLQVEE